MSPISVSGLVLGLVLGGVCIYPLHLFNSDSLVYGVTLSTPEDTAIEVVHILPPEIIVIPSINLKTSVEYIGITSTGEMDTPKDSMNVGWYALGVAPGATGTALITGHYGWKSKKKSAFDNLSKLRVNDMVTTINALGVSTTFIVTAIKSYPYTATTTDIFVTNDQEAHLNLITCSGTWNKKAKSYSNRLVIFTNKKLD